MLRESGLHRHPRVQRPRDHHCPHPQRHQPPGQGQDGPGPGAEEQRFKAASGHHGEQVNSWRQDNWPTDNCSYKASHYIGLCVSQGRFCNVRLDSLCFIW